MASIFFVSEGWIFAIYIILGIMSFFYLHVNFKRALRKELSIKSRRNSYIINASFMMIAIIGTIFTIFVSDKYYTAKLFILFFYGLFYWIWWVQFIIRMQILDSRETSYVPGTLLLAIIPLVLSFLLLLFSMVFIQNILVLQDQFVLYLYLLFIYIFLSVLLITIYKSIYFYMSKNK